MQPTAAILTIGSELVEGLRVDTNSAEVASALSAHGFSVTELVSVGDDIGLAANALARLTARHALVVTTGGLGPTHDDITREAAAQALGTPLVRDARLQGILEPVIVRHRSGKAAHQVLRQADVLPSSVVIDATTGTAPGMIVPTSTGHLALLPGPPSEMRPMLRVLAERYSARRAAPRDLGVAGTTESDAQVMAQAALRGIDGVQLTVLARPGDVRVVLFDDGAGESGLDHAARVVASALGDHCYTTAAESLAEVVVRAAAASSMTYAIAESCTGGMVAAAITSVPGSSEGFLGGVVAYQDEVKADMLDVDRELLREYGAVSQHVAIAMADGVRARMGSDVGVSITGVAGPGGGTETKPVGLVFFGVANHLGSHAHGQRFSPKSREAIRERSTFFALDLLRRQTQVP